MHRPRNLREERGSGCAFRRMVWRVGVYEEKGTRREIDAGEHLCGVGLRTMLLSGAGPPCWDLYLFDECARHR